jgi:hypothetical protein
MIWLLFSLFCFLIGYGLGRELRRQLEEHEYGNGPGELPDEHSNDREGEV